jgi:hypothetical protein
LRHDVIPPPSGPVFGGDGSVKHWRGPFVSNKKPAERRLGGLEAGELMAQARVSSIQPPGDNNSSRMQPPRRGLGRQGRTSGSFR